jgi:D-3-phosphoglycerate dehydrogenase / 2-oxoglutarate reductase
MHKVVITDFTGQEIDIERRILETAGCQVIWAQTKARDALMAVVADAEAVITQFAPVDASVIDAMTRCRVIVRYGIGVDNVDLRAAAGKRIPVCNVPDYCVDEVADHALALILDATRRITTNALAVRSGQWRLGVPMEAMRTLKDLTVGVVAFGRIGREVVNRLRPFKCRIVAFDPAVDPLLIQQAGCTPVSLAELLAQSDLITLHCPSTETTRHMINATSLAQMKPSVILVNASRGSLVDMQALTAGLQAGRISAAALDVTDPEPIPPDSPLLAMEGVVITAHIASVSPRAVETLRTSVARTALLAIRGMPLPNIVNGVPALV